MRASFDPQALDDLRYWVGTRPQTAARILDVTRATLREPFSGDGKPEPLKYKYRGCWSRRVDKEHRLIYRVEGEVAVLLSARFHYG